jgi:hypothetical protein
MIVYFSIFKSNGMNILAGVCTLILGYVVVMLLGFYQIK